jgi:hypothetical protein
MRAALAAVTVLDAVGAGMSSFFETETQTASAEPSKPNHIRWCIDVTLVDISSGEIVTQQSCGETKNDCRDGREAALNQPRPPISVSECYKQKLDELK